MERNANTLLDALIERHSLKNDAALSRKLQVAPPTISKIRHGMAIGDSFLIRIHDFCGMGLDESRELAGIKIPDHV
jgi:hypothetical protein